MDNVGLVVEGGGTKIAYSAGVLECFLQHHLYFPYGVGISAGSEVLLAYASRQPNRLRVAAIDAASQKGAVGLVPLFKEGSIFGIESTNNYLEKHAPFDFEAFFGSPMETEIGVYNMDTNQVEYFGKPYVDADMTLVKASCALLLLARPYKWNGHRYFDAGLVDMISVEQALAHGCDKVIVLSTKEKGYRRKPAPKWQLWLAKMFYHDPVIVDYLKNRHIRYQEQWDLIERLEQEGRALVIRPEKDMKVTRYTTDARKLRPWYQLGYDETLARLPEICRFCGVEEEGSPNTQSGPDFIKSLWADGAFLDSKPETCANMNTNR